MNELTPERLSYNSYFVGWICALDVELAASVAMLDYELPKLAQVQGDSNTYVLGRIGLHNIVLTCLPAGTTGTNAAANAATNMLRSFPNIRFCLMVGIGGGAPGAPCDDPSGDIRLGDVVISCPSANSGGVLQYDFGKTMSEGNFVQTGVLNKTSIVLSNSVSTMRARHRIEESHIPQHISRMLESHQEMQREFSHPGLEHDQLFRADYEHPNGESTCNFCDTEALIPRKRRNDTDPVVHYGLIGSANQVMKHGATRDKLRAEKNVICFEMEAAGLMDVFPCLVVRGICDYADSHKNKRWQPHAAVTAAACAKEVLLATPASETAVERFFNAEAICNMLRTTLYELNWHQMLDLLPLQNYRYREHFDKPQNCDGPDFHWALRNIDFKQWSLNEGHRVLFLTGHPSEGNLSQLSSYVVGQEKAAGYPILPIFCSTIQSETPIATFFYIFLQELVYRSPEAQRTPILRSFISKLLEAPRVKRWMEKRLNGEICLKYMKTILEEEASVGLLDPLKIAFEFEKQRRLLVVINKLDAIQSMNEPASCVLLLMKHLQQRNPNIRILLTSSERPEKKTDLADFLHIRYDEERKECLRSLQFDNTRYEKISEEYEGSFEWIWTHNEYESWSASDISRLIYIQGKPGSGKSTIMKYFNRNLLLKEPAAQQAVVARFFYSFRDGELQRSHYYMLLSILYEILNQDEGFFYHQCQTEYRSYQRYGPHFKWNYASLKRLLKSLQDYQIKKRFYLVIDAVDESEEKDRREILGLLLDLCSKTKHCVIKICMASRPVVQVEARRDQFHNFIKLDDETKPDIFKYAQSQLYGLNSTSMLAQATEYMLKNAQGVFLWIKLISEQLIDAHEQGYSEEEVFELLQRLPTELEDFYVLMLEKMKQNRSSLLHAAKLFGFILFAKRPLTVDELLHALGIFSGVDSGTQFAPSDTSFEKCIPSSERVILSSGGNFLEIKTQNGNKIVQIMHQTVREFFLDPDGSVSNSEFRVSEKHAHMNMAFACIRYLSVCVANDSMEGKLPLIEFEASRLCKNYCKYLDRRPLACYALRYIKPHFSICKQDTNFKHAVSQFFEYMADSDTGTSLLGKWANSTLYEGSLSSGNAHDASATSFKNRLLQTASIHGFSIAAEIVLLARADTNSKDEFGRTALFLAVSNGHEAIAKLLLANGADIHTQDSIGQTPLSVAAMSGYRSVVLWLLENGASIDGSDRFLRTPLSYAAEHGHLAVVKILVEKGARIDRNWQSPLLKAAENGHLTIVDFLVERGAFIENKDSGGRTPLLCAAEHGRLAVVKFMVQKGANIEHADMWQQTPLFMAVANSHFDVVRFLVREGANVDTKDCGGQTPISTAVKNKRLDIVKLLLEMC
ncbi:putative kinesin [Trichoderma austrokoningii]